VAGLLLERGAEVSKAMTDGVTPFFVASHGGHDAVVKLLLERGAEVNRAMTDDGTASLHAASERGHDALVRSFLKWGAVVNEASTDNDATALHAASAIGHEAVVRLLLERGAEVNKAMADNGVTPFFVASAIGHEAVVELLLERGADIDRAVINGMTLRFAWEWRIWTLSRGLRTMLIPIRGDGVSIHLSLESFVGDENGGGCDLSPGRRPTPQQTNRVRGDDRRRTGDGSRRRNSRFRRRSRRVRRLCGCGPRRTRRSHPPRGRPTPQPTAVPARQTDRTRTSDGPSPQTTAPPHPATRPSTVSGYGQR
jgi:hypothetical protein